MKASETNLQEIIEGTKQYVIPLFQRPYSWQKAQWEMLWNDILELYEHENPSPHFMGSIVTMQTDSGPESVTKYLLIDGQQRLTTVFIILAVLRDKAKESEQAKIADAINNQFLANIYVEDDQDYYKLQPTQADRQSFHQIIKYQFDANENNNINNCYLFFQKKVRQDKNLDLSKIKAIICQNLLLVSILLGKDDNPYLVFESLNAKGRPLTQADLIRNYFFMQINAKQQESIYAKYWLPMQDLLGDNLTEFIRHYLTKSGVIVNQNDVYTHLKERISRANKNDTLSYLKDISQFSKYYARFLDPNLEENPQVRRYLQRIKRLDMATVYPFLMNCYHDWQQGEIKESEFIDIFKVIENYILRRFVCNVQTQGLNRIFASLYTRIIKETNLENLSFVEKLKFALQTQNYPKDIEFREKLLTAELYGRNRTEKTRLILESLEESFHHKEKVSFENLTIEHIMPQTLSEWWKNNLGDDYELTHELLLNCLGNLTLTGYNSEFSNNPFPEKKRGNKGNPGLNDSHLELNKYFQSMNSWQREDIEKRTEVLADRALEIWPYFGDESVKVSENRGVTGTIPKMLHFLGNEYPVKSWRDVLETTLNSLSEYEADRFQDVILQFPRLLGWDEKNFRETRQLKNGVFIEVSLSAKDINTFCQKVFEIMDISADEWSVEVRNKDNN
jgi:uncharacterized protein with ParB-like and HNH nuclease domain